MVFRASLLNQIAHSVRGIDFITGKHKLAHDRWVLYLANMLGEIREIDEYLVDYRQHGQNAFGAVPGSSIVREKIRFAQDKLRVRERSDRTVRAAQEFRDAIDRIPIDTEKLFPLFDRRRSILFWNRVLRQQLARNSVHHAPTRLAALRTVGNNVLSKVYIDARSNKPNPKDCALDILSALL